jgi:hypothetical protein
MELTGRPLAVNDCDGFINCWQGLSPAEITRMGVAISRMPSATRMVADLKRMLTSRDKYVRTFVLAWCVNGKPIGYSSLKDAIPSKFASISACKPGRPARVAQRLGN